MKRINIAKLLRQTAAGLAGIIMCLPSAAMADNLIFVAKDSKDSKFYLNYDYLKKDNYGFINFVYTMRYSKPDKNGILFIDAQVKGHCESSRLGIESLQAYNVNDRLMGEHKVVPFVFDIVQPGSMQFLMLDAACRVLSES